MAEGNQPGPFQGLMYVCPQCDETWRDISHPGNMVRRTCVTCEFVWEIPANPRRVKGARLEWNVKLDSQPRLASEDNLYEVP